MNALHGLIRPSRGGLRWAEAQGKEILRDRKTEKKE